MSKTMQPKEAHVSASPLLAKVHSLGLELPVDLERLAIRRGCDYYDRELPLRAPPLSEVPLSDAELAISLIIPVLHPTAREIRLSAALLGAPDVRADEVAALAVRENCVEIVRHIALSGRHFEPQNPFWEKLLDLLPKVDIDSNKLPHPTRFVEMTGIDRGKVGRFTRWIRPRQPLAA